MLYFDHSATTPISPEVLDYLNELQSSHYGNPSSTHKIGQKARVILEQARRQTAAAIGAEPDEIIFTGGGSESNNLVLWNLLNQSNRHVITSSIEHPSILTVLKRLEPFGITATILPVDSTGRVNAADVERAITEETVLVTIMLANNEVGTVQPIAEVSEICRARNLPFHTDAVQAPGKIPIDVRRLGVDTLSLSAHKFYGPKGVGALYVRRGLKLQPLIVGGGQERGLRSGTENVPGIAALGLAAELAGQQVEENRDRLTKLESLFRARIKSGYPTAIFNGNHEYRLPGLISLTLPDVPSDFMLINLDLMGLAVSSGSACSSGTVKPSSVLKALNISRNLNLRTLRISFGKDNTADDVERLAEAILTIIKKATRRRG